MPDGASVAPKSSIAFSCLPHLLEYQAERIPDAPAILAPGRAALSYSRLHRHIEETGCALRAMGIARHDRVAVVLPNGPEMAVAILTVAGDAAGAPLNPAYVADVADGSFADVLASAVHMTA